MSLAEAREAARAIRSRPRARGGQRSRDTSFASVAERWLTENVEARGLQHRQGDAPPRRRYVLPDWGARSIHDIDQDDVNDLLDRIAEEHGPVMADQRADHAVEPDGLVARQGQALRAACRRPSCAACGAAAGARASACSTTTSCACCGG